MRLVGTSKLVSLQKSPDKIRNICILAHVDHGKTTLADSLVASNGIISQRLAGKLRYMDSRKDEQERGITMKSSSIALYHQLEEEDEYLINLIDSPGHVDFSTEVTTAVRLCDGAIVVIDAVEGVCAQTIVALRQAWQEDIKPILVLNKIDRIILELKLTPIDAYVHITQLLEKVNAVMAELLASDVGKETSAKLRLVRSRGPSVCVDDNAVYDWATGLDNIDDSELYFAPEQGNVVFACAIDGWGFRVSDFAAIFSKKLGFNETVLRSTLWGNFYINTKSKRIMKGAQEKAKKPLFVQLVLENIWSMYDAVAIRKDKEMVSKMVNSLGLQIHPRDLKQTDPKTVLASVMSKWLPLSKALLGAVCEQLPSPLELSEKKVERLMFTHTRDFSLLSSESQSLKKNFLDCDSSEESPVIIFVSKMFAIERKYLPENRPKVLTPEDIAARRDQARQCLAERLAKQAETETVNISSEESTMLKKDDNDNNLQVVEPAKDPDADVFIAFARVYSGTVKKGCKLYILGPRYDPVQGLEKFPNGEIDPNLTLKDLKSGQHVTIAEVTNLYQLMGRELEIIDNVPSGNILGIGGLDEHILKTATISSTLACPPFTDLNVISVPILRVAIEPMRTADMESLINGLRLLNQADPCVQILVQETGEHVLVTAGEVHLQRCVDDLRERFAKVEVSVSKPIVPFRETIIDPPKTDMVNELIEGQHISSGDSKQDVSEDKYLVVQSSSNKKCTIKVRSKPLPAEVTDILEKSSHILTIMKDNENVLRHDETNVLSESVIRDISELKDSLADAFENANWPSNTIDHIWSFGPKKCGPNVLINNISRYRRGKGCVWPVEMIQQTENEDGDCCDILSSFDSNFVNGFQLASLAGPLCEEPMSGVAFLVEDWTIEENEDIHQSSGPFSGQLMGMVKDACRKAFQANHQRLKVAMYSCSIQVNSEVLGKLYAVLGKRGGRILHGDLQEGSTNFEVIAQLPVIESFNFANEVRRQTSGLALPQLVFSGWEILEIDPFWQPTTEEEYLHFGEKADTENRARKYMNAVRKRKGLRVEEKTVEHAEKQRTLTRNK